MTDDLNDELYNGLWETVGRIRARHYNTVQAASREELVAHIGRPQGEIDIKLKDLVAEGMEQERRMHREELRIQHLRVRGLSAQVSKLRIQLEGRPVGAPRIGRPPKPKVAEQ